MPVRNDLDLYDRHGDEWWEPDSAAFRSLRSIKRHHLELVESRWNGRLAGSLVVDLGSGGGFLTVPLAERGACAVGVDLSRPSLLAGRRAAAERGAPCRWIRADAANVPLADGAADFVLASDVLEHVDSPATVIRECARLLKAGGGLFVNTINRTLRARLLAVSIAEGLRLVPPGTHDPRMFIRPDELEAMAAAAGLRVESFHGEAPRILRTVRRWTVAMRPSRSLAVTFSAFLVKEPPSTR